jgi:amino acid transporter
MRHRKLAQHLDLKDLIPLSVSSVGPLFSVAATGGVMAAYAGVWTLPAIFILAFPFIVSSFVFRLLNKHFPQAGASYHWSARVLGESISRYQAWILILAYFTSIPPIAIPAGSYTIALIAPQDQSSSVLQAGVTLFWIVFAAVPLLLGAKPTARITQVFFTIEMLALTAFAVIGISRLNRISVPIHFSKPPIGGMLVVAVIAATILDGWEIDSYAAEESKKPREHPGLGGIIGAFGALLFYALLYPLMIGETPIHKLANSSDPLAVWASRLIPGHGWAMLIPVLASTAGGLWLTTYILTRALYAMGRERLLPVGFAKLNKRNVPSLAILVTLSLTFLVVLGETFISSLSSFFNLILSAAGFFLLAEFFMDSLTAVIFLTFGHKRLPELSIHPHKHKMLMVFSFISSLMMGALLVAFFIYGPKAIGAGIDQTLLVLLGLGIVFTYLTRKRKASSFIFEGKSV